MFKIVKALRSTTYYYTNTLKLQERYTHLYPKSYNIMYYMSRLFFFLRGLISHNLTFNSFIVNIGLNYPYLKSLQTSLPYFAFSAC